MAKNGNAGINKAGTKNANLFKRKDHPYVCSD